MNDIIKRLNDVADCDEAVFSVHDVRALVAVVQMLTNDRENIREPLLHFILDSVTNTLRLNGRLIATYEFLDFTNLIEALQLTDIPYRITKSYNTRNEGMEYTRG
jgi:hypothetical protein